MKLIILKKYTRYVFFLVILVNLYNCKPYFHYYEVREPGPSPISSHVTRNEIIEVQDTIIVKINGTVIFDEQPNPGMILKFMNTLTNKVYSSETDFYGNFNIILEEGIYKSFYDLEQQEKLELGSFTFKSGEVRILDFNLKTGCCGGEYVRKYVKKYRSLRHFEKTKTK